MLGKDSAPSGRASWSVLATSLVCFIFAIGETFFMFVPLYHNPGQDGSIYHCLLDSMAWVQPVDDKAVFVLLVLRMLITLSGWSQSLLLINIGMMLSIFVICLVVSSYGAVLLLLLVIDSIGTPLSTSDHCFVSCVHRVFSSLCQSTMSEVLSF